MLLRVAQLYHVCPPRVMMVVLAEFNKLRFMQLVYDTSGCSSQGLSWSPSNRYLNRSKLASTRLCNNHIFIASATRNSDTDRDPFKRRR